MITFLVCLILVISFSKGKVAPILFGIAALMHDLFLSDLNGMYYYVSAGVFDGIVAWLIYKLELSRLVLDILVVCAISASLNAFGWVIWLIGLPPDVYNTAMIALYICACIISGRGKDAGNYSNNYNLCADYS